MLRRCRGILKISTAIETVTPQPSPNTLNRIRVEVAGTALKDFKTSASDAPELLEPFTAPRKGRFREKEGAMTSLQLFVRFFLVGGATIGGISILLNNAIEEEYEKECLYADLIKDSNDRHAAVLKDFIAPSSYQYLVEKMKNRESQEEYTSTEEVKKNVLHNEVLFRMKVWWNWQLSLIDRVLTKMYVWHRLRLEEDTIRSAVEVQGYELVRLKKA